MPRLIDPSLEKLSSIMSEMGENAITCISLAIDSFLEGRNTSKQILELSENIRGKYFDVEDLTFDMMLKYQPVADDFRLIRSSTEISYAFNRFGRYAYDISLVRDVFGDVSECVDPTLIESSQKVKNLIKNAVTSFAQLDIRKASQIQEDEETIDKIYKERLPQLIKSTNTKCAIMETLILRYLERIGDHAVFMSDAINYIVTGKHRPSKRRIEEHTK